MKPIKISATLKANYNDGDDSITFSKPVSSLTSGEMIALLELYLDGCCPVCLAEIAAGEVVCDRCLDKAKAVREAA